MTDMALIVARNFLVVGAGTAAAMMLGATAYDAAHALARIWERICDDWQRGDL